MVFEPVRLQSDRFEPCQMIEQRIARHGHEHTVAGIAQDLEEIRVALTAARGQEDTVGRDSDAATRVIGSNRFARISESARVRIVGDQIDVGEHRVEVGIREARSSRIRLCQIDHVPAAAPRGIHRARERCRGEVGRHA